MHICQGLTLDTETCRSPGTGPDKNRSVAVAEKVFHEEVTAQNHMRANLYAHLQQLITEAVQQAVRQTVVGNAVTKHTSNHITLFKDRDAVTGLCKDDRNGHARRAAADDGNGFFLFSRRGSVHAVEISVGDEFFDLVKLNRVAFFALDAVAHALVPMIADDGADNRHGIVVEKHLTRFHQLVFLEKLNYRGDRRMDGAALLAQRFFTQKTAVCLCFDMKSHFVPSLFCAQQRNSDIVHVRAGRTGDNQAADFFQCVIGIVVFQDFKNAQALFTQFCSAIPIGIAAGSICRPVCPVAADGKDSCTGSTSNTRSCRQSQLLISAPKPVPGQVHNCFAACDKSKGFTGRSMALEDTGQEAARLSCLAAELISEKHRFVAKLFGGSRCRSTELTHGAVDMSLNIRQLLGRLLVQEPRGISAELQSVSCSNRLSLSAGTAVRVSRSACDHIQGITQDIA